MENQTTSLPKEVQEAIGKRYREWIKNRETYNSFTLMEEGARIFQEVQASNQPEGEPVEAFEALRDEMQDAITAKIGSVSGDEEAAEACARAAQFFYAPQKERLEKMEGKLETALKLIVVEAQMHRLHESHLTRKSIKGEYCTPGHLATDIRLLKVEQQRLSELLRYDLQKIVDALSPSQTPTTNG